MLPSPFPYTFFLLLGKIPRNRFASSQLNQIYKGLKISSTKITVFSHMYQDFKKEQILHFSFHFFFILFYFHYNSFNLMTSLIYLCTEMSTPWTTSMQPQSLPVSFTYCHKRNFDTWSYQLVIGHFITTTHYLYKNKTCHQNNK